MRVKKQSKKATEEPVKLKLDGLMREGRLRTVEPDLSDIWHLHSKSTKKVHDIDKKFAQFINKLTKKREYFKKYLDSLRENINKKSRSKSKKLLKIYSKKTLVISGSFIFVVVVIFVGLQKMQKDTPATLGVNEENKIVLEENKIAREEVTFEVLTPNAVSEDSLKSVTRKSPSGSKIFTFQETRGDVQIEVTQQEMPEQFKGKEAAEIEKIAKDLQATSVIQINEAKIYHGLSEKLNVQSLITVKNNVLIFIRSNQKQSDEFWTGYYLSLQ